MRNSKLIYNESFEYEGSAIAIKVHADAMTGHRYSLRGHRLTIRLSAIGLTVAIIISHIEKAKVWAISEIDKSPKLQTSVAQPEYTDGQILTVGEHQYTLTIHKDAPNYHRVQRNGTNIVLHINANDTPNGIRMAYTTLLSRMIAGHQAPEFIRRVHEINQLYFKLPLADIKFKYNTSNWGSCSYRGNLNFSTRLLFAPQIVKDSVIIHELAHRIEMNHGERFWAIVAKYDPNYLAHDAFLKAHSHLYKW